MSVLSINLSLTPCLSVTLATLNSPLKLRIQTGLLNITHKSQLSTYDTI